MSVLINGSPSEEINIKRGLKQGDPLAPFLFLLVAEGLGGVMKRAVELNSFRGFRVGRSEVVISHLQYVDDTICVGEASINNLWSLKTILRGFEMSSGLKVNYWKSSSCLWRQLFSIVKLALFRLLTLVYLLVQAPVEFLLGSRFSSPFGSVLVFGVTSMLVLVGASFF
jgi:hypothetical protein